ncbi:PRAME family member 12-like [Sigmodon hispidus]
MLEIFQIKSRSPGVIWDLAQYTTSRSDIFCSLWQLLALKRWSHEEKAAEPGLKAASYTYFKINSSKDKQLSHTLPVVLGFKTMFKAHAYSPVLNARIKETWKCLQCLLETLAITHCMLSESDMSSLSQCPRIHQLKHLYLSGVIFLNFSHPLSERLPAKVKAILQTLELKGCMIMDLISALLPALSQCSQLIEVNLVKNFLSVCSLKKLLQHTANLRQLAWEIYPAPDEVYNDTGDVLPDRFAQHCSELMKTLRSIRQPKEIYFALKTKWSPGSLQVSFFLEDLNPIAQRFWNKTATKLELNQLMELIPGIRSLINIPCLKTMKVLLDGQDVLIMEKLHPR